MIKRILVIDDDVAVRKLFSLTLEDTNYQVDTASSGKKGIAMVEQTKYNLIYLDLKMPEMNGVETLRLLRKIDKNVPIFIITAFHEEFTGQLKEAANDGLDFDLLRKPLTVKQLISVTEKILDETDNYSGGSKE